MKRNTIFSFLVLFVFLIECTALAESTNNRSSISSIFLKGETEEVLYKVLGTNAINLTIKNVKTVKSFLKLPPQLLSIVPANVRYFTYFNFTSSVVRGIGVLYSFENVSEKDLLLLFHNKELKLEKTPRLKKMIKMAEEKGNITKLGGDISGGPTFFEIRDLGIGMSNKGWYTNLIRVEIRFRFTYLSVHYFFSSHNPLNTTLRKGEIKKVPVIIDALFGVPKNNPKNFFLMEVKIGPTNAEYARPCAYVYSPYDPYIKYLMGSSVSRSLNLSLNFTVEIFRSYYPFIALSPTLKAVYGTAQFSPLISELTYGRDIRYFSAALGVNFRNPEEKVSVYISEGLGEAVQKNTKIYSDPELYLAKTGMYIENDQGIGLKDGKPVKIWDQMVFAFSPLSKEWWTEDFKEVLEKASRIPNLGTYKISDDDRRIIMNVFCQYLIMLGKNYHSNLLLYLGKNLCKEKYIVYNGRIFTINVNTKVMPYKERSEMTISLNTTKPSPFLYEISLKKIITPGNKWPNIRWKNKTIRIPCYEITISFLVIDFLKVFPPTEIVKNNVTKEEAYSLALRYLDLNRSQVLSWNCSKVDIYWRNTEYMGYSLIINDILNESKKKTSKGIYEEYTVRPYVVYVFMGRVTQAMPLPVKEVKVKIGNPSFLEKYWRTILFFIVLAAIIGGICLAAMRKKRRIYFRHEGLLLVFTCSQFSPFTFS